MVALVLALLFAPASVSPLALGQQTGSPNNPGTLPPGPGGPLFPDQSQRRSPEEEQLGRMKEEAAKKANQQRQEQLKRDTDKLLKLATELKEYVDKSNENLLSVDVVKKADQIEKLAHSVREKMKGSN
jgi:hypothetical protein